MEDRAERKRQRGDSSFSKEDRKIRIEVGYGLEHRLTDLICGRIIRNHIVPNFKAGRFDDGLRSGVAAILEILNGRDEAGAAVETSAEPEKDFGHYANSVLHYLVAAILVGIGMAFFAGVLYALFSMAFFQTGVAGWAGFAIFSPVFFLLILLPAISALESAGCGEQCFTAAGFAIAALLIGMKIYFLRARGGKRIAQRFRMDLSSTSGGGSSYSSSSSWSSSGSSSSGSSSFSGGGGSFGGEEPRVRGEGAACVRRDCSPCYLAANCQGRVERNMLSFYRLATAERIIIFIRSLYRFSPIHFTR
jgi:uncharacterized protein